MAIYGFDEAGARRISEFVRQSERTPRVGRRLRRQPPVLSGTSSPSGVDLSPCGCGSCVDRDLMTIAASDFSGEWDAACSYYVTIGDEDVELVYQGSGVWSGTMTGGDTITLTATGQEPEGVTLERNTSAPALVARWVNTVTYWKTHCDATLFLTAVGDDTDDDPPGCSICLKVQRSTACGDCLNDAPMTVDKADFNGTANAACSYVIFYDADDRELLYDGSGIWSGDAFGVDDNVLRLTVTSPAAGDVLVELLDDAAATIGTYENTSTWNPKCPIKLIRKTGDGPCSICLSLDADLVAACAGGG